jgi:ribosomal protein L7/L12
MGVSIQQGERGFVIRCGNVSVPVAAIRTAFQMNNNSVFVIKLVRDFTGLGLLEARDVVMLYKMAKELGDKL